MNTHSEPMALPPKPWWRHAMVWLVLSGPLVVVVAGVFTAYIAIRGADEVLSVEPDPTQRTESAQSPAIMARNHAATPEADVPQARTKQPR